MKYKTLLPGVIFFLISVMGFSQPKKYLYYFDKGFNSAEKSTAAFNGVGAIVNGVMELNVYNAANNNLVFTEHCTDSSLQVNNGLYASYHSNALIDSAGNFLNGKKDGLWIKRDTLGRTTDSTVYNNGAPLISVTTSYYKNGTLAGIEISDIKNDLLNERYYNEKGQLTSETNFNGQKGILKYYDSTMKVKIDTVFSREEIEASFPGGEEAWTHYITKQIERNIDALVRDGKSGTCRVKFIVDKKGNITAVEALNMKGTRLAKVVIEAIVKGPKWVPASQYGRYVNAFREQPVTFSVQ